MKKLLGGAGAVLLALVALAALGPPASATTVGVVLTPSAIDAGQTTTATVTFIGDTGADTLVIDTSSTAGQIGAPLLFNGGWVASCTGIGTSQVTCPYVNGSYPVTVAFAITVPSDVTDTSWTVGATMQSDSNQDLATLSITPTSTTTTSSTSTTSTSTTSTSTTSTSTTSTTAPGSTTTSSTPGSTTSTSTPGSTSTTGDPAVGGNGATAGSGGGTSGTGGSQSGTLPYTGVPISWAVAVGLLMTGVGAVLLQTARLRRS